MKKLIFLYFLSFPVFSLEHVNEAHLAVVIVQENVNEIDNKIQSEMQESPQSKCPSGSSTKVKVALISASATVISAVILLIIHFTK